MRWAVWFVVVANCSKGDAPTRPQPTPPVPAPAPQRPACDLGGDYRFRFRSNGTDGWWFRAHVDGAKATLPSGVDMLGLPAGPIALTTDAAACKLTLSGTSDHAGDVRVELELDAKTNAVTGTLTRSKKIADDDSPVAIRGRLDRGPLAAPGCLHPGVFDLAIDRAATWKMSGDPIRGWSCPKAEDVSMATVRIEPFGDELVVEVLDSDRKQTGDRPGVTRSGDCALDLVLDSEALSKLHARLTFGGDAITGEATLAETPLNDPQSGDPRARCTAEHAKLIGKRVAD